MDGQTKDMGQSIYTRMDQNIDGWNNGWVTGWLDCQLVGWTDG